MIHALETALTALRDTRAALEADPRPEFHQALANLRRWQSTKVAIANRDLAAAHDADDLRHFLTRSFYLEADWSELTRNPRRIASTVGRIVSQDRPLVIAVELQLSADRLDARVAEALIERDAHRRITPTAYVRAFRRVGEPAERARQIRWVADLIEELSGYADNRAAYWAFKLAGGPARALQMRATYALLAEGFAAMRAARDLEGGTRTALARQHAALERLLGHAVPTGAIDTAAAGR